MTTRSDAKNEATGNKVTTWLTGGKSIFGGREQPLRAHEVFCSCKDGECQFKREGKCVCMGSTRIMRLSWCPYGDVTTKKGYTSRAQKYYAFRRRYESDSTYKALDAVSDMTYVRIVGDYAYIHVPEVTLTATKNSNSGRPIGHDGQLRIASRDFGGTEKWLRKELFDVEAVIAICEFSPYDIWTNEALTSYKAKTVPAFVEDLRLYWPEMYAELNAIRPDLCGKEVDYRGRKAKTATLRAGIILKDAHGNKFVLSDDRTELRCESYRSALMSVGTTYATGTTTVVMPVGKNDTVKVKDNDWVIAGETVFA